MSCECDIKIFPRPLAVRAGLTSLTRQLGAFPEWRQAVLAAIGRETALDDWNSREPACSRSGVRSFPIATKLTKFSPEPLPRAQPSGLFHLPAHSLFYQ